MEPSPPPPPELSPGDVIAGKFRLERIIGRGGMGAVWAARHVALDMPVALKFIEAEGDPAEARARFEREARAAAQIRSPHVVQIIDHGIDGERPYIAMELLEGEDLGTRLRQRRRIGVAEAARIVSQAAKALRRAHDAGIIHRDLKPGNVFLAKFDDDEVVKLLDFGVAKMRRAGTIEEPLATRTGIVFGSPSYMSPEQARGARNIDHRSDLWSLAVILFRALTGTKPFHGPSLADLVIKLCIDPLPVATHIAPDLPPAIDAFFERAFARDPDHRFASASELAAAFEAAAAGHVEVAAPAPLSVGAPPMSSPTPSFPVAAPSSTLVLTAAPAPAPAGPLPMSYAAVPVETTPSSGMSAMPSGGWGVAPPGMTTGTQVPVPFAPAGGPGVVPVGGAPAPGVRLSALVLAGGAGGGLLALVVLVIVLVARRGTPVAASPGEDSSTRTSTSTSTSASTSASASTSTSTSPSTGTGTGTGTTEVAAPGSAEASSKPVESAEPAASVEGPAPEAGSAAPPGPRKGPVRSGRKRRPNFGY